MGYILTDDVEIMDRKKFLIKRRIKYMIILSIAFLALLVGFDFTVYAVAKNALYQDADNQMLEAREHIASNEDGALTNFLNGKEIIYYDDGSNYVISYKIFLILRDSEGEILNADYLVSFDYMMNIKFSTRDEEHLKVEKAERNGSTLYYRTYTMRVEASDGEYYYLQMATDSTDIEMSLQIILKVLFLCTVIAMAFVVIVGWYLSKSLVQGVAEAWEKQDEFISYASHELRSPLAIIHSSLELLLETPGKKIIDRSELIMNSLIETSRLRKMTSNLIEMVKLQATEMQLDYEVIVLKEMVEGFIEPFIYQAEATGKKLNYSVQEDMVIVGDKQLLTELVVILLENALKYTKEGDVIKLNAFTQEENDVIEVADTGIGISDDAISKVFTRFYREERQQAKTDGSGLGLYVASLITQRHGGKIAAKHNKPKGTIVTVKLPLGTMIKR